MDGDKDLIIQQEYGGDHKSPLVTPLSKFDELMYNEIVRLNKRVKMIKEILEGCNEKSITDDSSTGDNRL